MMRALVGDIGQALKQISRHRTYAATTIAILALGLGVNAAAFAVSWHFLLKPLPWPQGDRLVQIWNVSKRTGAVNVLAPANYLDFARETRTVETIAAYTYFDYPLNLTGDQDPIEIRLRAVTGDYFAVFGSPAQLGRTLSRHDEEAGDFVMVISDGLWRRRFGSATDVVGRRIQLDDRTYEIVGVMPASFDLSAKPLDGWVPLVFGEQQREQRLGFYLGAVGRLGPGAGVEQAASELGAIAARASERYPASNANIGATARALRDELVGPVRTAMLLLTASAVLVLLIACANLASLQLGRLDHLKRELAIRSALGASRGRLFRSMMMEGIVLSGLGGIAGLGLGLWSVQAVASLAPPHLAQNANIGLDPALGAYIFLLSIVAGALFGSLPAYRATRSDRVDLLRSRTGSDRRAGVLRATLVAVEVALATTLLVGASVLLISLANVLRVDPGFETSGVIAADLRLPSSRYPSLAHRTAFFDQLTERLQATPGVLDVCATNALPFETSGTMTYVPDGTKTLIGAQPVTVSVDCFRALGIALRAGRTFDRREASPVAIVSEGYARRAWPGENAVGKIIRLGLPDGEPLNVIGVVEDTRRSSLESLPFAQVYQPAQQTQFFLPSKIVVRTAGGVPNARTLRVGVLGADAGVIAAMRGTVRDLDQGQPVENVRLLEHIVSRSTAPRRFTLMLLSTFAVLSVLLAAVGVYGLLSQLVSQRRSEIGVRLALGAAPATIVRFVTAGALRSVAAGVAIGLAGAWAAARVLQRFVFEVSATDPVIYGSAALLLTAIAAVAAYVPTRRATRIDPLMTLRAE